MRKTAMALVLVVVALIGYGGLKGIDLGTDYLSQRIAKSMYRDEIFNRRSYQSVVLPCIKGATDSDVVRTGQLAVRYMQQGMMVEVCGREISWEMALEMANF